MGLPRAVALVAGLISLVASQFPPNREGITVLKSKFHENVTISFKEPGICETTPGVKSYSGYVHLPPGFIDGGDQDYPINTFFWFFEARKSPETAPLAVWLNGGPGASSMMGLLEENGPCFVAADSKSTFLNEWSWNNEVNMLYLDQPSQVGFSYDVATNCTLTLETIIADGEEDEDWIIRPTPDLGRDGRPLPETNYTFKLGTLPSQNDSHTVGTTAAAAHTLWHFMQTWFFEFPHYRPENNRLALWVESYGGHYGPAFMRFFREQNDKIRNGSSDEQGAHVLHFDTLGIVNGLVDTTIQMTHWISFPYNNTYGIQLWNESLYTEMMHNWTRPGGCRERALACQKALEEYHGPGIAFVHSLQNISPSSSTFASESNLTALCTDILACVPALPYYTSSPAALPLEDHRGWFDITHPRADPFPEPHHFGFLSEEATLRALGVPVNFTSVSAAVHRRFDASFDFVAGGFREALAWLLDGGDGCVPGIDDQDGYCDVDVAVHLIYGDRDYACAWPGGEEVALSIPWMHQEEFVSDVGYAPLLVGERKEWKGMTRQLGPLSFTRVFQAGHEVPSYQPQAAYEIFTRAMSGRDVATGKIAVRDKKGSYGGRRKHGNGMYRTTGPTSSWHVKNEPPPMPRPRCYVLKPITCVPAVWERVKKGQALVRDWFVIDDDGEDERLGLSDEL